MKIIDLLNKIANGEELPKKIRIKEVYHRDFDENDYPIDVEDKYIWELDESYRDEKDYCCGEKDLFQTYLINRILNNEVEVLEEKEMCHKCGKYPAEYNQTYCEFCLGISEEDKKIEELKLNNSDVWTGKTNEDLIVDIIIEIIKKLNKEE